MAAGSGTSSAERASHPGGRQQAEPPPDLQSAEPYPVGVRAEARGQDLACADEWDPSGIPLCRNHGCLNTKGLWSLHVFRVRMAVPNFGGRRSDSPPTEPH